MFKNCKSSKHNKIKISSFLNKISNLANKISNLANNKPIYRLQIKSTKFKKHRKYKEKNSKKLNNYDLYEFFNLIQYFHSHNQSKYQF